ncbi:MAG TPA: hypothetical protein VJL89_11050, partial [Thermodesulfovibrionia bacterium]|nr:hypothetical protein [Thermodesulfovibrionia bacterium]
MKSKLEIYALSVCFTAVVSLVISVGIAGYSVFEILTPELTMSSYEYDRLQTNDAYRASKPLCNERENTEQRPSEEELTKQRKEAFEMEIRSEKRKGFQT